MKLLFILVPMVFLGSCARFPAKESLRRISEIAAPEKLRLEAGFNLYVQRAELEDGTEVGVIRMKDGTSSRYWFRSHHLTGDMGGTWIEMSDGTKSYLAGWFCCEVQLPNEQLASLDSLKNFIRNHHGIAP
jgi:hypothetical protein